MRLAAPSSAGWPVCWFGSPLVGGSAPSLRPFSVSVSAGAAHKGGNYATRRRTQGLDPALVCGACFLNRGPCVRTPRGWCAIRSSPPGVWPWCGCSPWCGRALSAVSTLIASAARPALARVFHWAVGVVGRVRSVPGPGAGCSPGRGRALSARVRVRARVVETDARCRHREGVVDIVRGLSTPRGGYNARWCQQRASVRTTRAHANNARRRPRPEPSSAVTTVRARSPRRRSAVTAAQSAPRPPGSCGFQESGCGYQAMPTATGSGTRSTP